MLAVSLAAWVTIGLWLKSTNWTPHPRMILLDAAPVRIWRSAWWYSNMLSGSS